METHCAVWLTVTLFTLCQGSAWAHANAGIDSIDVIGTATGALAGIETTVGYLRTYENDRFHWLCHEAITQPDAVLTPQYTESSAGVLLATVGKRDQARDTTQSLYRSEDGCNWSTPEGLSEHQIAAVSFDPHDDTTAIAVTANNGTINRAFRSTDSGRTWTPSDLAIDSGVFRSVLHSRGTLGVVWASSIKHGTEQAWVYRSTDGGHTWTQHPIDLQSANGDDIYVDVVVADIADPQTAWIVKGPFLDDELLRTTDGGESFETVYAPGADIIDGTQDADGGLWLTTTGNRVIHSPDGDVFKRVDEAPMSLGVEAIGESIFFATRVATEGTALSEQTAPNTYEAIDTFLALNGPPECAAETDSAVHCEPLWPDLEAVITRADDTGTVQPDTAEPSASTQPANPTGCCSDQSKQANVGLFVLIAAWLRRRMAAAETQPSHING